MLSQENGVSPIAAIIVTFNSARVIEACLKALSAEKIPTIVVDNASTDDTVNIAQRNGAKIVRNICNEGFGRANNIGAKITRAPYLLFINPDCSLEKGCGAQLLEAATRYPDAGILAPRVHDAQGTLAFGHGAHLAPYLSKGSFVAPSGDCCLGGISGAVFLARRDIFFKIGGFDKNIFLFFEDDDLGRRTIEAGYSLVHVDGAKAIHLVGKSSPPTALTRFRRMRHYTWSECYTAAKWGRRSPVWRVVRKKPVKALSAVLRLQFDDAAMHIGSMIGAFEWLIGRNPTRDNPQCDLLQ